MYPYIAPENFENSKISSISNDQLSLKVSDLLQQKEITKYIQSKEELIQIFEKYCEFFKFSEDKEKIQYILPEGMTVFSILNIPPKLNKEEVKNHIELINLQYNRLYKKGFYWILSTIDKETVICVQNSLRELIFDEVRIKYIHNNKNQILKSMKDKMDKNIYQKESKYLGINNSNNYSKNNYKKGKASDSDSDAFSWRKGSGGSKSSFDYGEKPYKKNNYYNKYKRKRFNSDNDGKKSKNYYQNYGSNNSINNSNQEIEIDISNLKYSLNIKNKFSFGDIKNFYEKKVKNNNELKRPQFLNETLTDILSDKPKEIVSIDELIECNEKNKKEASTGKKIESEKSDNKNNLNTASNQSMNPNISTNIKIPKMNPLSGMSKNFNKFDIVPGNAMPGLMMPFQPSPWIEESNQEE